MVITSLDNKKIKEIIKLKDKKYRKLSNSFICEGEHLVFEAYKNNSLKELILEDGVNLSLDVDTIYVSHEVMKKISDLNDTSGILGIASTSTSSDIIGSKFLLLDGIQDPGNLGTIIRSALAFNIDTIILSPDTVDLYNPKVVRSTQGMLFHINIVSMDLKDAISVIKNKGIRVYGTSVVDGVNVSSINDDSYAVIMGSEGLGIKKDIMDLCEKFIYIEMNKKVESLNVGVATSIILYELNK